MQRPSGNQSGVQKAEFLSRVTVHRNILASTQKADSLRHSISVQGSTASGNRSAGRGHSGEETQEIALRSRSLPDGMHQVQREGYRLSCDQIHVRAGKGNEDRVTMLPRRVKEPLLKHLKEVKRLHDKDPEEGFGYVYIPGALELKYPNVGWEWGR